MAEYLSLYAQEQFELNLDTYKQFVELVRTGIPDDVSKCIKSNFTPDEEVPETSETETIELVTSNNNLVITETAFVRELPHWSRKYRRYAGLSTFITLITMKYPRTRERPVSNRCLNSK